MNSGIDVSNILQKEEEEGEETLTIDSDGITIVRRKSSTVSSGKRTNSSTSLNSEKSQSKDSEANLEEQNELLKELEASSKGKIKGSILMNYFKSANRSCTFGFLVMSFILSQLLVSVADIAIAYW